MYSYITRMSFVFHLYIIRMSLICHPYVTRMYSYVIRMSLACTRMSSICRSYVLVCHPYVTGMWFYHEPLNMSSWTFLEKKESCVVTEIYFASLVFIQDFVWCWGYIIKQIFPADFCLISKSFTLRFALLNITYIGWISNIKQKVM